MRNFKSLVLLFEDPFFLSFSPDEREDFALALRNELSEAERLVLMHLFSEPERSDPFRTAIARADALGGQQKIAKSCLGATAENYGAQVRKAKNMA